MEVQSDPTLCHEWENHTPTGVKVYQDYGHFFEQSPASIHGKLHHFPKYVARQEMSKLFCRYELFKKILPIHGSVVEIGCCAGSGIFTYAHASSILEPYNYSRKIIGFDTFQGYPQLNEEDQRGNFQVANIQPGSYSAQGLKEEMEGFMGLFDQNRPLGHLPKIELVEGDVLHTLPQYLKDHPELIVSMLNLDTGLYASTKVALELLLPHMPKGALITFDTVGVRGFPGENLALKECLDLNKYRIERLPFEPARAYLQLE